jgi:hypothetical protein
LIQRWSAKFKETLPAPLFEKLDASLWIDKSKAEYAS